MRAPPHFSLCFLATDWWGVKLFRLGLLLTIPWISALPKQPHFEIEGLKQTSPDVILQFRNKFSDPHEVAPHEVETELQNLKIFEEISIEEKSREHWLIRLKEKNSFYPVPIWLKTANTHLGGLFLVESNLFGRNMGGVIGGIYSDRGWQILAGFTDPHINYSRWFTTTRILAGEVLVENTMPDNRVTEKFSADRIDWQGSMGYRIHKNWSLQYNGGLRSVQIKNIMQQDSATLQSGIALNQGAKLRFHKLKTRDYYDEGFDLNIEFERGIAISNEGFNHYTTANSYAFNPWLAHLITLNVSAIFSAFPAIYEQRMGGWPGTRSLPAFLIPADRFFTTAVNYQMPVYRPSWGTFTVIIFYDMGTAQRDSNRQIYFGGPGAGFRVYLKRITIPAFGIDVCRDNFTQNMQFSFFLGYQLQ